MTFNYARFNKWENETHIPSDVMAIAKAVCATFGILLCEEETITLYNRGGYAYGYMKGFRLEHCTSSYADGPSPDYSGAILKWLKGIGFEMVGSYGDNGMDSATNWHDTFWTHEIGYTETLEYDEEFEDYAENEGYDEY